MAAPKPNGTVTVFTLISYWKLVAVWVLTIFNRNDTFKKQVITLCKNSNFTYIKIVNLPGKFTVINSCG
jgi:hypothetical protein